MLNTALDRSVERRHRIARRTNISRALRRRRITRRSIVGLLLTILISIVLDHAGVFGYEGDDWRDFDKQSFVVIKVVDGDTVRVKRPGNNEDTVVRLLGIDAPELRDDSGKPAHFAKQSADYARARMEGKSVVIRLEPTETRDKYRRLLAYLYLTDSDNLNLDLVRDGQAYADRRFKHGMRSQFEQVENQARQKGTGLWRDIKVHQMPPWRRKWLEQWQVNRR